MHSGVELGSLIALWDWTLDIAPPEIGDAEISIFDSPIVTRITIKAQNLDTEGSPNNFIVWKLFGALFQNFLNLQLDGLGTFVFFLHFLRLFQFEEIQFFRLLSFKAHSSCFKHLRSFLYFSFWPHRRFASYWMQAWLLAPRLALRPAFVLFDGCLGPNFYF